MTQTSVLRNPHLEGSPFYWEAGPIGVLLCHGFTATTAEVRLLAQTLHSEGYSVAGPLLPGHGTTPRDCNRFSWQDWYASVEQTYQQLAVHCPTVVIGGESTGALLALYLAVKHSNAAGILCYAPALRLKLGRLSNFLLSVLSPFITSVPKPPSTDDNPWQGYAVQPLKGAIQLKRLQAVIHPLLPKIHQPILILQGGLDPIVHPQSPQIIIDRVSSTIKELHWLEHSTHCVILDKERDMAASLTLDFLQRLPGS
ncbi:MAG: alpha/beta fold hydrolase [Anaerolineales bacterium]